MISSEFDGHADQPDDSEYPARDAPDEGDEAMAQISDGDIDDRPRALLGAAGYGRSPDEVRATSQEAAIMVAARAETSLLADQADHAMKEAEKITNDARRHARQILAEVQTEARKIVSSARAEAEKVTAIAHAFMEGGTRFAGLVADAEPAPEPDAAWSSRIMTTELT
jgi:hypothetical protein